MATRKQQELLRLLIERSGAQGYLSTDDLQELAPDATSEEMRALIKALSHRGIDVVDEDEGPESPRRRTAPRSSRSCSPRTPSPATTRSACISRKCRASRCSR